MKIKCEFASYHSDSTIGCLENKKHKCDCAFNGAFDEEKMEKCSIRKLQLIKRNPPITTSLSDMMKRLSTDYPNAYMKFLNTKIMSSFDIHSFNIDNYTRGLIELGLYPSITPEFYQDGINWNWQVLWYVSNDRKDFQSGTFYYGDNNEYPSYDIAILSFIEMCFMLLEAGLEVYILPKNN